MQGSKIISIDIRRILQTAPILVALASVSTALNAQDVSLLYSKQELQNSGARYAPNLRGLWEEDFILRLSSNERLKPSPPELKLPLLGASLSPIAFYSEPLGRKVYVPISSVKFLDDMSVAFSYYDMMGCDQGIVSDYAAALRFHEKEALGSPLDVLGVPRNATEDPYVEDVAQKMLKSTIFFLIAHEYAHVLFSHKAYSELSAIDAQQQESEADLFALNVMRRIGVPPIALAHFFLLSSRLEASPGDFDNAADYEWYLHQEATHPVSALRLLIIADAIDGHEDEFSKAEPNAAAISMILKSSIVMLRTIASTLDDRKMRLFLADRARDIDISSLRFACKP